MPSIAAEARVALKTVYLAFETKAGLLRAVWEALKDASKDLPEKVRAAGFSATG